MATAASLTELLRDSRLAAVIDCYLNPKDAPPEIAAAARYSKFLERLQAQRFVLPVVGVQGCGKSTLLNAITFDRPVLPVAANETTCVPVEIGWAQRPSAEARVVYHDGHQDRLSATENALLRLVDNDHNPGNKLGVDRVILQSNCPALRHGLVLVDLPGTGSLTAANMATTRRYLDESVGVVFLLRTVPPLTRSECIFVALQWSRLPFALFVQNRWTDETDEEVENGREYNLTVLEDLARRNRIPLDEKPVVHIVNAYRAYQGKVTPDANLMQASGLQGFLQYLDTVAQQWPVILLDGIQAAMSKDLCATQETITRQLDLLAADRQKLDAELRAEQDRFNGYISALRSKRATTAAEADQLCKEQETALSKWEKASRADLRNKMRTKLRSGIVDGLYLERALRDEEIVEADEILEVVQEAVLSFQDRVRARFKDVTEWKARKPDSLKTVTRPEATKWEELAPHITGGAGALAGGLWAGAQVGALAGAFGGPVGMIVGGLVGGVLGGLLGQWAGQKAKQLVIDKRADSVQGEVFAAIDDFIAGTCDGLRKQVQGFRDQLTKALEKWETEQVGRFEAERDNCMKLRSASREEREKVGQVLRQDLQCVDSFLARLQ